jgi:16S rRNA C967 or C1407 C5-methylase (RsmB/RsmF family)
LNDIALELQKEIATAAQESVVEQKTPSQVVVEPIDWFSSIGHRFLRMPVAHRIASTPSYISGKLYGIDISSAAAVVALDVQAGEHVLDLCCAPGAKLSMISDVLKYQEAKLENNGEEGEGPWTGSVTGVDISSSRLAACKTVAKKYELANVRLFLDDACTFNCLAPPPRRLRAKQVPSPKFNKVLPPPEFPEDMQGSTAPESLTIAPEISKKTKKSMKKKNAAVLDRLLFTSDWALTSVASQLYDKAIVDAQCTLDASIRHLLRYNKVGWIDFEGNPTEVISHLQKKMIFNAFRLLKPGGSLVYATCSFCTAQNEDVVRWLLQHEPTASVLPIRWPPTFSLHINEGNLPHTVRFYPKQSGTSGMFIAKIYKASLPTETSQMDTDPIATSSTASH